MRNIFKSLMFVAVAAMTFTACEKDNAENNNTEQTRVVNFTATIGEDGTRSGFSGTTTDEGGKTAYTSKWDGGEMLILKADNSGTKNPIINADGTFSVELGSSSEFITLYSPAISWKGDGSGNMIPDESYFAEQTPREDSVDPNAHILSSDQTLVGSEDNVTINMHHAVAYGKMTVNTPADFEVTKVVVKLVGEYYGFDRSYNYTLHATNVKDNVFWFGTMPIIVSQFTVLAYNADGDILTKDVTIGEQPLNFDYGKVSKFSVSDFEEYVAPTMAEFTSAVWTNTWANSDKLVQFTSDTLGTLQLNFYNCNTNSWIDARTYTFANSGQIYPGGSYSWYETPSGTTWYASGGTVNVSIVDGQYYFEFLDITDLDNPGSYTLNATFKGEIEGLDLPQ